MPKVSVIIPIYGVEKYLNQCLDSVLSQTLQDIEIILVDDGSQDRCPEIVDKYAKKDKRIIAVHQPNAGYGRAVNHGMEIAGAEYIGIVEGDDWVDADMFEALYDQAVATGAEIVKSSFFKYMGNNINETANNIPDEIKNAIILPRQHPAAMRINPSIWSAIYKKDFLNRNDIKFSETPGASYQDTGFHFKTLLAAQKVFFWDKAFYHYRTDNIGSSVKDVSKIFCVCDEWNEIRRWVPEIQSDVSGLLCFLQYHTYMWNWKRLSGDAKNQFLKRFSDDFNWLKDQGLMKEEYFNKKEQRRLHQIIDHPARFHVTYQLHHLPHHLIKNIFGTKHG